MAIATRPPQTPIAPRSIADAPRRWPKRLLLVGVVVLVIALVASASWLARYQPLTTGGGARALQPYRLVTSSFDATGADGMSFSQSQIEMRNGVTYRVEFPIWNEGRLPVRIDGLAAADQGGNPNPIRVSLAGTTPPDAQAQSEVHDPFAPFTLSPGQSMYVFLDIRVNVNRWSHGTSAMMNTAVFDTTVAGMFHRDAKVFWGMTVEFCRPPCVAQST